MSPLNLSFLFFTILHTVLPYSTTNMVYFLQKFQWHFSLDILRRTTTEYISQVHWDHLHSTTNKRWLNIQSFGGSCVGIDNAVVMQVKMSTQAMTVFSYTQGHDKFTSVVHKCKTAKFESKLHNHMKRHKDSSPLGYDTKQHNSKEILVFWEALLPPFQNSSCPIFLDINLPFSFPVVEKSWSKIHSLSM